MVMRAILSGRKTDLQEFIEEWYQKENAEIPVIGDDMDVILEVKEQHEQNIKTLANAFRLNCHIFKTAK